MSICFGSPPVPRPTYHLTTVRPPASAGLNVSTATGVGVADGVVWAAGADHALDTVSARMTSVAPQVSTARLSIGNSLNSRAENCHCARVASARVVRTLMRRALG